MYGINWEDSDVAKHEYKVGDKVRNVAGEYGKHFPVNATGSVSQVLNHGVFATLDGGDKYPWFFGFEQIEPTQADIKVGDRVRLHTHTDTRAAGDSGAVVEVGGTLALVAMEDAPSCHEWLPLAKLELGGDASATKPAPEPKFKAGDVVRCIADIADIFDDFTEGKTYTVGEDGVDEYGYVSIVADDAGDPNVSPQGAFELVSGATTPHIVVRVEGGQPFPTTTPRVHDSAASATAEAERRARNNPGTEFAVYQRVTGRVAEVQYLTKEVA